MAVTTGVQAPTGVPDATDIFRVLAPLPGDAILAGVKLAVTPFGNPLTDNAIADLKPFTEAVVRVIGSEPPAAMLTLEAVDVSVKLGTKTVRAMV